MAQIIVEIIIVGLLTMLAGIIWMVMHDFIDDDRQLVNKREEGKHRI